CLQYNSRPWTF
nr:immunoglobulin light chain junction region [Macaca mulatta]MOW39227.1 immunoglobulin light chain junction region [Macaca mulatta]